MTDTLDRQSGDDLEYTEDLMRQLYATELDRKDKILASMTVVTGPLAILFAGVAYLANGLADAPADPAAASTDILVAVYGTSILALAVALARALFWFHRLVDRDEYEYLPAAQTVLNNIDELKDYADTYGLSLEGQLTELARRNMARLYAVTATSNRQSNDRRLAYRQGVFRSTAYALISAGLGCMAVALHRQVPHIFDMASVWSLVHG